MKAETMLEKQPIKKMNFFIITLPLILWTMLMVAVSSTPGQKLPEVGVWNFDKFAHCVEYFIFSLLLFRYIFLCRKKKLFQATKLTAIISVVYAGLDELHQWPIPNRCCTWQDFAADSIGVVAGVYIAYTFYKRKKVS